ncbi:YceI family protein [Emticicia sp. 21SJ11W-3]|uniref:YceI family protein n=1 Tax=Emticicia sp. 21SJ11W-3 TaxID=2916755 RepID=UPI00209E88A4|nr:YceI family protein [Emticicia sp. 21SJ11W-3]UTA66829.1 YceI family protein [Emticicia sp. 21SJ11W-3]
MKTLITILAGMLISAGSYAQNQWICSKGETSFFSETPLENIAAVNKNVVSIIDFSTGQVAVKMNVAAFKFKNHLMEEHFNENYMETEKYPVATFSGKMQGNADPAKNGTYDITATGQLTMHGVSRERTLKGRLIINGNVITLLADFDVALKDHKIDVPTLVIAKIAENIAVKNKFVFSRK